MSELAKLRDHLIKMHGKRGGVAFAHGMRAAGFSTIDKVTTHSEIARVRAAAYSALDVSGHRPNSEVYEELEREQIKGGQRFAEDDGADIDTESIYKKFNSVGRGAQPQAKTDSKPQSVTEGPDALGLDTSAIYARFNAQRGQDTTRRAAQNLESTR